MARNTSGRHSNIADTVAKSAAYQASQVHRKRIEEVFAWVTTVAGLSKTRHRGLARVGWQFTLALVPTISSACRSFWERRRERRNREAAVP